MLIAFCPTLHVRPPASIYDFDRREIEIGCSEMPWGAQAWITCTQAIPHVDRGWPGKLFITLTVEGDNHRFCDAYAVTNRIEECAVPPGSLFIVDPLELHWLLDHDAVFGERALQRWVGLQWEVPREHAAQRAREIARDIGAEWVARCPDDRYATW